MDSLVSGIVLEGLSTAGKTSVLRAIKKVQANDEQSERSVVILGEHYSQQLQKIHGEEVSLSESAHAKLLTERIDAIAGLNSWAVGLGPHRRASRGLFYLFERFHLNHRISYPESNHISNIEKELNRLSCRCILLTVSADKIESRLKHRSGGELAGAPLKKCASDWLQAQDKMMECADKSSVPTTIVNTDDMAWNEYAKFIMESVRC